MQIVIDIPEEQYITLNAKSQEEVLTVIDVSLLIESIKNGTPLPKGHGRLIDADKIILEATEKMEHPANHKYMECVIAHMKLADTIIKADGGDAE